MTYDIFASNYVKNKGEIMTNSQILPTTIYCGTNVVQLIAQNVAIRLEKRFYGPKYAFNDIHELERIMKITRFEPWSAIDLLHRDLHSHKQQRAKAPWVPAVDIIEEKARFVLRADVPGVEATDIDVTMDAGVLTVGGVRHQDECLEDTEIQRNERTCGRFVRRFSLPDTVDADSITAKCSNGILNVAIPKLPEIQARHITVEAA